MSRFAHSFQLKRQHSAEPFAASGDNSTDTPASGTTPPAPERSITPPKTTPGTGASEQILPQPPVEPVDGFLGSPLKKQRASVSTADENALRRRIAESSGRVNEVHGAGADETKTSSTSSLGDKPNSERPTAPASQDDEEL